MSVNPSRAVISHQATLIESEDVKAVLDVLERGWTLRSRRNMLGARLSALQSAARRGIASLGRFP